jgi:GTP-binding protein
MKIPFSQVEFLISALDSSKLPPFRSIHGTVLPEMAIVGRSNVGKSSLINHLLRRKSIAKVSATPGKTKTINFFSVDDALILVDLPGYGYAKAAKDNQEEWSKSIDLYIQQRESLKLILLLLDIRRVPSKEDLAFFEWVQHHHKPLLLVFTKHDKIKNHEREMNMKKALEALHAPSSIACTYYSISDPDARKRLCSLINENLHGNHR